MVWTKSYLFNVIAKIKFPLTLPLSLFPTPPTTQILVGLRRDPRASLNIPGNDYKGALDLEPPLEIPCSIDWEKKMWKHTQSTSIRQ